jgi:hypothetical protein
MDATTAINNIRKMLGLQFKKETFKSTFLADGTTEVTNNMEDDFQVGQTLYVVKESTLAPAPQGDHETRDGLIISVDTESTIIAITSLDNSTDAEVQQEGSTDMMTYTEAKDAQGQVLESKTFDVGEDVFLVHEDGSKTPAPDGEHQVVLKDESGNENKIRIQVKDGKIIQRENVEEMMKPETMSTDFSKDIEDIKLSLNNLLELVGSMNGKFKTELNSLKTDFESFKKLPERKAVEEKKFYTESFADYRLNLIKNQIKK